MEPESCPSFSDQVLLCFSGDSGAGACAALGLGFEHGHGFEAVPLSIPLRLKEFSVKLRGGLLEEVGASSPVLVLRRRDDGRLGPTAVVVNAAFDRDDQARVAHWLVSQIPVTAEKVVVVLSDEPQTPSPGRDSCRLQCAAWGGLVPAPGLSDLELMPDGLRIRDGLAAAAVHFLVAEQRPCCCVVSPGSEGTRGLGAEAWRLAEAAAAAALPECGLRFDPERLRGIAQCGTPIAWRGPRGRSELIYT
mmetsp:Transcript_17599/g.42217  ORF Transcript_17599/g.42217 Transcript_17599/m.42217 type:complete len:248 (+) Transcript_17599:173-916(+)